MQQVWWNLEYTQSVIVHVPVNVVFSWQTCLSIVCNNGGFGFEVYVHLTLDVKHASMCWQQAGAEQNKKAHLRLSSVSSLWLRREQCDQIYVLVHVSTNTYLGTSLWLYIWICLTLLAIVINLIKMTTFQMLYPNFRYFFLAVSGLVVFQTKPRIPPYAVIQCQKWRKKNVLGYNS